MLGPRRRRPGTPPIRPWCAAAPLLWTAALVLAAQYVSASDRLLESSGTAGSAASGPLISALESHLFNDGFPSSGRRRYSSNPVDLAIRLDMAADINPPGNSSIVPGDSLVADVVPLAGTFLVGNPELRWLLRANPAFDGVRFLPPGSIPVGPGLWMGTVLGDTARGPGGVPVPNRFFFDLPDGPPIAVHQDAEAAFFFPGDALHYYLRAHDNHGNVTTLPSDTTGYTFGPPVLPKSSTVCPRYGAGIYVYFTVYGLPGIWVRVSIAAGGGNLGVAAVAETTVVQPDLLLWNDGGVAPGDLLYELSLFQNGFWRGRDFDVYTTLGPGSGLSNGLGATGAHGASSEQLAGYSCILYDAGNQRQFVLCDGSNVSGNDKSHDVGVLTAWHRHGGARLSAYFGDNVAEAMAAQGATTSAFLDSVLGTRFVSVNVRPFILNQSAPQVAPTGLAPGVFTTNFVVNSAGIPTRDFDRIVPSPSAPGAVAAHKYLPLAGIEPASVWWDRLEAGDRKATAFFPYDLHAILNLAGAPPSDGRPARAHLLGEILGQFGVHVPEETLDTPAARPRRLTIGPVHPNPFNPSSTIPFALPEPGRVTVRVYNLRGQRIATLLDATLPAGAHSVLWRGQDAAGSAVASGVYVVRAVSAGEVASVCVSLAR